MKKDPQILAKTLDMTQFCGVSAQMLLLIAQAPTTHKVFSKLPLRILYLRLIQWHNFLYDSSAAENF